MLAAILVAVLSAPLPPSTQAAAPESSSTVQQACERGDMQACFDLAFLHWDGKVTGWVEILKARDAVRRAMTIDSQRGLELQRGSCEKGSARGCRMLAFIYGTGDAIPQDKAKATQLYRKACDLGDAMACWSLGFSYVNGSGVPQSQTKAEQLWDKACTAGHPGACNILGVVLQERNKVRAARLFEKACQGGWAEACANLGFSYRNGDGVARDGARATELFRKACQAGHAKACGL